MAPLRQAALLIAVVLWAVPVVAGHHEPVAAPDLQVGEFYMLRAPWTPMQTFWQSKEHGVVELPGGTPIKVLERHADGPALWYHVQWIKPQTLGDTEDLWGWINSDALAEHGVFLSY